MSSTPTVIRHVQRGNRIFQVISYTDQALNLRAVYQEYTTNPDTGRTVLEVSRPYLNENGAVQAWLAGIVYLGKLG